MFGVCSGVCFLLSGVMLDAVFTYGGSAIGVYTIATLWSSPIVGICASWWWSSVHTRYAQNGCSSIALSRGSLMLLTQLPCSHPNYMVWHTALGAWQSHLIPLTSLHGGEGSFFPGFIPSDDTVDFDSAIGIKPCFSGVVMWYQIDELTHTWSAEQFVAHSHIYPGFTGKVSSLNPLSPWTRMWGLFLTMNRGWIPSSLILLRQQNCTHPWMSLVPYIFSLFWVSLLG